MTREGRPATDGLSAQGPLRVKPETTIAARRKLPCALDRMRARSDVGLAARGGEDKHRLIGLSVRRAGTEAKTFAIGPNASAYGELVALPRRAIPLPQAAAPQQMSWLGHRSRKRKVCAEPVPPGHGGKSRLRHARERSSAMIRVAFERRVNPSQPSARRRGASVFLRIRLPPAATIRFWCRRVGEGERIRACAIGLRFSEK